MRILSNVMAKPYLLFVIILCSSCGILCESREDEITADESAENIPFIPTREWQKVRKGQAIPAGIHSRLNLQTGVVEAKLLDDSDNKDTALSSIPQEDPDVKNDEYVTKGDENLRQAQLREMLGETTVIDVEGSNSLKGAKKKFRSYEEIKKEFEDLKMSIKTDSEIISELRERFKDASQPKEIELILTDLDYLLHQTDNAINFAQSGGLLSVVLPAINSSHTEVVVAALRLLGSASQSNPKVQIAALEAGAVERVLRLVNKAELSSSALHALSCIIRRFPLAQKNFVKYGGPAIMANLFDESYKMGSNYGEDFNWRWRARIKAVTLLHDLILEHQQAEGEASKQYIHIGLKEQIISHNWCKIFPSLLTMEDDHDAAEKGAEAMLAYWDTCQLHFMQAAPTIFQAENRYIELSETELENMPTEAGDESFPSQSGYFKGLAELISNLGQRLRLLKDEL